MNIAVDDATRKNAEMWLEGPCDEETKEKIRQMSDEELIDAFYKKLEFGTGGLRGVMGVGSSRINRYTVGAATQGLARYLLSRFEKPSVLIGYDCRNGSRLFAEEAARVLAGNGIHAFLTRQLRPTPLVSFGCRHLKCSAAIMITASHNPPEYNGYKVYWSDGCQVLPPHDKGIIEEVDKIADFSEVKRAESLKSPLIEEVGEELDRAYLDAVGKYRLQPEEDSGHGSELKVVYSSLHGTGITLVPQILQEWGFSSLSLVESQKEPDGAFPTVETPNPEMKEALEEGIALLEKEEGDLLIATDPDADRVGVAVREKEETTLLNGNQIACICMEYICRSLTEQQRWPKRAAFIKTLVTTELMEAIARRYEKPCLNVLTGFKHIGNKITEWENSSEGCSFVFGGEESYGYLIGTETRDKDAVIASALICEAALFCKLRGMTLVDFLEEIYQKYGAFYESLASARFPETKAGRDRMKEGMEALLTSPPKEIAGIAVEKVEDYAVSLSLNLATGEKEPLPFPKENMLILRLADKSRLMIRPSGTEPKIKIYCGVQKKGGEIEEARKQAELLISAARSFFF